MTANVTIVVAHREGVLKVRTRAPLHTQDTKTTVAAVSNNGNSSP